MFLLTGGTGFISSHTAVALAEAGLPCVLLDNLANSPESTLQGLAHITGQAPLFVQGDVRDAALLDSLFARYPIQAVLHGASLKAVGESLAQPALYHDNNVAGTVTLIRAMERAGVRRLVFSSSSTVYGNPTLQCLPETAPLAPLNPEARSKVMVEQILHDVAASHPDWRVLSLRCFNPVGAHPSGALGEAPRGQTLNLLTVMAQAAAGQRPPLSIFGNDYPTPDGTGVRDYIHVMDLARGHLAALQQVLQVLKKGPPPEARHRVLNLGRGQGISVLQLLQAFEQHTGHRVPHQWAPRRAGDAACWVADVSAARQHLGWQAELGLAEMCRDAWRWQGRA
ncbi:UDP-glucose 4-epimerase GalE [Curvibacter gracilis]|uniref:UDP-glucose 4-epimerase GalE n=1 Tax=Curvibacter gracilis TaxID=230310 RepID=UPI0004809CF1|nr:UDP-glucose 4-epimerase GalE [Curvibacter gracilis]